MLVGPVETLTVSVAFRGMISSGLGSEIRPNRDSGGTSEYNTPSEYTVPYRLAGFQ